MQVLYINYHRQCFRHCAVIFGSKSKQTVLGVWKKLFDGSPPGAVFKKRRSLIEYLRQYGGF